MVSRGLVIGALSGTALLGVVLGVFAGGLGGDERPRASPTAAGASESIPGPPISATASPPRPSPSASASASSSATAVAALAAGRPYVLALGDGRVMDAGKKRKNGTPVIVRAAGAKDRPRWVVRAAGGGAVRLQAASGGLCLEADDQRAVQERCDGRDNKQLWRITPAGAGVRIVSADGRRALAPGGQDDGQTVVNLVPVARGAVWTAKTS